MVNEAYAMAPFPGGNGGGTGSLFMSMLPIIAMFAIFYFLLIRPQSKKQKEHQLMLDNLKEGDNVITTGGIYGTIAKIKEDAITLQVAENVKVKIGKGYISALKGKED